VNNEVEVIWKEADIAAGRRRGTQRKVLVIRLDYLFWLQGMKHDDGSQLQVLAVGIVP